MKLKTISEIMTADVISIVRDLPITQAIEVMRTRNIRRLPVVSPTGRLIGVISLNDAMLAMPKGSSMFGESSDPIPTVGAVMKDYVYTIGLADSVARAATLMVNHKISSLPVVEDKRMVGIVTESDIFRYLAEVLGAAEAAGG